MGEGPKPNSNVPIVEVPKWLRRGGVRPNWDNVLKYVFFEGIPNHYLFNKECLKDELRKVSLSHTWSVVSALIDLSLFFPSSCLFSLQIGSLNGKNLDMVNV